MDRDEIKAKVAAIRVKIQKLHVKRSKQLRKLKKLQDKCDHEWQPSSMMDICNVCGYTRAGSLD